MFCKRSLFFCIIFIVIAAATLLCAVSFAFAEEDEASYIEITAERIIPTDYYEFSEISIIAVSSNGTIAVIDSSVDGVFLKIIGNTPRTVNLSKMPTMLAIYNNYVIGNFVDDYLQIYAIIEDEFISTDAPSNVFDIAIDESKSVLYTLTRTKLKRYALDSEGGLGVELIGEYEFPIDSPVMANRIAAAEGIVYMYSTTGSKVHAYNSLDESITEVFSGLAINENLVNLFCPHDEGFLLIKSDGIYYNSYSNKVIDTVDIGGDNELLSIKATAVADRRIYVVDNLYNAIKVYDGFVYEKFYGSYGDGSARLKNPTATYIHGDKIYVADSGNNRVVQYDIDDLTAISELIGFVPSNPQMVAASDDGVYVASNEQLYFYQDRTYSITHSFTDSIVSITASNNEVYVAAGNKVFNKSSDGTQFIEYLVLDEPISMIAKGLFGNILYVHYGDSIATYYNNSIYASTTIDLSEYPIDWDIVALDADYCGNVYVATTNNIYEFIRYPVEFELNAVYSITNADTIKGMSISSDGQIYLTTEHRLVAIDSIEVSTKANSGYDNPTTIEYPVKIAKGKGLIQKSPNNYEDVIYLSEDEYLLIFNSTVTYKQVEYLLVEYNNEPAYISKADAIIVGSQLIEQQYVRCLFDSVNIYQYPSATSEIIFASLTYDNIIKLSAFVAVDGDIDVWGWYQVIYEDRLGYVQTASVVSAESPYVKVERYYAKAKSSYFGATVKVYSQPDIESEVLDSLSDGVKVELASPLNKDLLFAEVRVNGGTGYILTNNLMEKGLTDGQILAIVMSIVTVVASVVLLLMLKIFKKQKL